jgi:hypothetical protein
VQDKRNFETFLRLAISMFSHVSHHGHQADEHILDHLRLLSQRLRTQCLDSIILFSWCTVKITCAIIGSDILNVPGTMTGLNRLWALK